MSYWVSRQEKANKARADKAIADIEKQLKKYYSNAMRRVIADFEATYNKLLDTVADGRDPTPADLYKLDQYWKMQAQLKNEMQKLGDKEIALLSKEFENEWIDIYKSIHLPSDSAFSTFSADGAKQMINSTWLADGKTFSQRVWGNTERLVETLNEELVHCVITGKKPTELRELLQERFNVSYNRADTLVKTEVAHIETAAAAQRYQDYGLDKYEFLGRDEHDIGCACKKLDGQVFFYSEMRAGVNAPPIHPNCRCAIIPVIDDEIIMEENNMDEVKTCARCGKEIEDNKKYCSDCAKIMDDRWLANVKKAGFAYDPKTDELKHTETSNKIFDYNYGYDGEHDDLIYACIDCGKVFHTNNKKAKNQKRCPECQEKFRKMYKAQKEKERRARKKLNK